jgi:hypothetical protein
MRPGSVIGEQQGFLCTVQRIHEANNAARSAAEAALATTRLSFYRAMAVDASAAALAAGRAAAAREQAAQVAAALDRQSAGRMRARQAGARPGPLAPEFDCAMVPL